MNVKNLSVVLCRIRLSTTLHKIVMDVTTTMKATSLYARLRELFAQDPLMCVCLARVHLLRDVYAHTHLCSSLSCVFCCSDEVGLVLGVDEAELTPANAFVLEEHKLGVALSAGPQLFREARTRFHELNPLFVHSTQRDDTTAAALVAELLDCTRAVLLISADFYTAWNTRCVCLCYSIVGNACTQVLALALMCLCDSKWLVERGWLDAVAETQFCDLVFTLHPKSIDTWAYRRWLATHLLSTKTLQSAAAVVPLEGDARQAFCDRQVAVCSLLAEQKPRNYHAWSFRHWIASLLPVDALEREFEAMALWCKRHITDHSGWNHRQHVLNVLIQRTRQRNEAADARAFVRALVVAEHAFLSTIMATYASHEALWCHRRFVVQLLVHELVENVDHAVENEELRRFLNDLTAKTASAPEKPEMPTSESLAQAWRSIETALQAASSADTLSWTSGQVLLAVAREVETAWCVGHRYALRFALWCVERVLRQSHVSEAAKTQWRELAAGLRICLRSVDPLLDDLWRNQTSRC